MNDLLEIKEANKVNFDKSINHFLDPDKVYIPIIKGMKLNKKSDVTVTRGELILKGTDYNLYSPVSGEIKAIDSDRCIKNESIKSIVIENDFKETYRKRIPAVKYINEIDPDTVLKLIDKYNLLDIPINPNAKTLVVSGIEVDPFERNNTYIINNYSSMILETVDALINIFGFEKTLFCITNANKECVYNLTSNIGTYPNITLKVMDNTYPLGIEEVLIKRTLTKKDIKWRYNYLTVSDIYNIYKVLKRDKPITEKLITVGGNCVEESKVVEVKIGTAVSDIIENTVETTTDKYYVIENGLLSGTTLENLNNIITLETRSIFLNKKNMEKEKKCINCGLCMFKCPVGLNPKLIKEGKGDKSKCIHCGACTYVCPSKINFKKYLGDKNE
jgi:electron transport complex protein RnfC